MRTNRNMLTALVCPLLFAAGLTGCGDLFTEDAGVCAMPSVTEPSYVMFNVTSVSNSGRTRANPTGGEWGDGREIGQTYENEVTSLAVFLYQDQSQTGKGVNGEADTPVTMLYFNNNEVSGEQNTTASADNIDYIATTEAKEVQLDAGTYNVLAIANPKDLTWASEATNLTLGDVRDHIETSAWDETTIGDGITTDVTTVYSSFLMTSENEGKGVTIESSNTKENPAQATVDVERMAARVDYQANGTFTINEDEYGNETGTGDAAYQGATVEITGAAIVNNLTAGSYELKRTSGGPAGTGSSGTTGTTSVTYLGEETADADGIATNYVIDPWTDEKTGGSTVTINNATANISDLYGVYYPGYATDDDEQNPSYWADLVTAGTPVTDDDGTTWNIVGYTMENTTYADYTSKQYSTALVFAATFTPAEGTVVNSWSNNDTFFTPGTSTFFKWNNTLYATAEDMMVAAYPSSNRATGKAVFSNGDAFGSTTFSSITNKDGLMAFIATLSDSDPTGYKAYLQGIVEADDFDFPTDKSSLYWGNYMQDSILYSLDEDGVVVHTGTRALLYSATNGAVRTYENSQCYYTWWIRHSNDGDNAANGIMEYSIVRNNIYKVRVNSVYSIGGDIPEEGVRAYVYVKNWTMLPSETIDL